jgi:hypothetical protein
MTIEIEDFPIKMVIVHSFLYVYQRVTTISACQKAIGQSDFLHGNSIPDPMENPPPSVASLGVPLHGRPGACRPGAISRDRQWINPHEMHVHISQ